MDLQSKKPPNELTFIPPLCEQGKDVITEELASFLCQLASDFSAPVLELLKARQERQGRFDAGDLPDFLPETADIRKKNWCIRGIPEDLQDRRIEITGPPERKMVINALNANVKVFMADFEDSFSPAWGAVLQGQRNLTDAIARTISYQQVETGRHYTLGSDPSVLICRVRGLHLIEKHVVFKEAPIPAALFDFAVYFYRNYKALLENGSGPYFYLPKLQSYQEAAWWNAVFCFTEDRFELPRGTIKATVLIETLPAVFEMDEILYQLKDHIVALNCGRWDYIFSYIKTFRNHPDRVLPDRQAVTMDKSFLNAYSRLLVKTCHRRGAMAMGGMAAFIPSKDPEKNAWVLNKITGDKTLEVKNGHDGSWVAHPGLADTAKAVFDTALGARKNQLDILREEDAHIFAEELLAPCEGERTEEGMRHNIRVAVQYIEAWIGGNGCVPIYGLMEDAATAEIARASIWQWIKHKKSLSNGKTVTADFFRACLLEEMQTLKKELGASKFTQGQYEQAGRLMEKLTTDEHLADFLTLSSYEFLN